MLRRLVSHLLAPAEAPAAAAPKEPKADNLDRFAANAEPGSSGGPPNSLGDWMKNIPDLGEPEPEPDPKAKDEREDDSKGTGTVDKGGVDDGAAAAATKAKADADAKAAEDAKAKDAVAKADDEADDKMPRSRQDWDKFKAKRQERETALKKEIEARDARLKEFETKYTEVEGKLKEKPPTDPEVEARAKALEAENKALTDKIIELDVTQHPKFKAYYDGGVEKQIGNAKKLVGAEKADQIEKILKLPDGEYKKLQMREFVSEMDDDFDKQKLGLILNKIDELHEDREAEIEKAGKHRDTIAAQRQASAGQRAKVFQTAFDTVLKQLQDPKDGMVIYQKREGDDAWNAEVTKTVDLAKRLLSSDSLKPETILKLTFDALAMPKLLTTFHSKMTEWQGEKAKFEAQIKELTAAQPGGRGTGGGAKENGTVPRTKLKEGMTPHEASQAFARGMVEAANAE